MVASKWFICAYVDTLTEPIGEGHSDGAPYARAAWSEGQDLVPRGQSSVAPALLLAPRGGRGAGGGLPAPPTTTTARLCTFIPGSWTADPGVADY